LFGIVRSIDSHPTVTSFQHIIRHVSLGARLSTIVRGANVDNVDCINILVKMSKCLQRKAKECDIESADLKAVLEDELLKELTVRYVDYVKEPAGKDCIKEAILYYLCGYMIHSRPSVTCCIECKKSVRCDELELPPDFTADHYTAIRNRGKLVFVTVPFFQTFRVIESIIEKHFEPIGQMYVEESFQKCISKIAKANIIPVFCDQHRDHHLPYLIREFVCVRYHFESKRLKDNLLKNASAKVKTHGKLSKHA